MYKKAPKITPEERERLLAANDYRCYSCNEEPGKRTLHLDHCHETGAIRGMLCNHCNTGLGSFQDDPFRLEAAARYLIRHGHA